MKILLNKQIFSKYKFTKSFSISTEPATDTTDTKEVELARTSKKVLNYFETTKGLKSVRNKIPLKYFVPKRRLNLSHLYLTDRAIARSVVERILPELLQNDNQVICETNAGLGLITRELLDKNIKTVRVYESCDEFRTVLKKFGNKYPNRVELFIKNIFSLDSLSRWDDKDSGNRVEQLLRDVPVKNWNDDPAMTIIGPMPNLSFINYLIRMLTIQREIVTHGRPQIFALMKPMDYVRCTATTGMSLHTYQKISVLFQILFDYEFLEKYPRKSFLPWETKLKEHYRTHYHSKYDVDYIYFVKINLKRELPVQPSYLLHLHYFVTQCMIKRKARIIPTLENWLPGIGVNLIVPQECDDNKYFKDMSIFTQFGELTPNQILQIYIEMTKHPDYDISAFVDLLSMKKKESVGGDISQYDK